MIHPWLILSGLILLLAVIELALSARPRRMMDMADRRSAGISVLLWLVVAAAMAVVISLVYQQPPGGLRDVWLSDPVRAVRPTPDQALLQFITCYVTELALSVDNLALWALLFAYYRISPARQSRILFYGIGLGLAMRLGLIWGSAELWHRFDFMPYVFGAVLALALLRTLLMPDWATTFDRRLPIRALRRLLGVGASDASPDHGAAADQKGRLTLLMVLLAGAADITYAADSVPVAFSITRDPLIAFAASACVILMLRSLFLAIGGVVRSFRFMKLAVGATLLYFVVKLFVLRTSDVPVWLTLVVVSAIYVCFGLASWLHHRGLGFAPVPATRPAPVADLVDAIAATKRNLRKVMILIAGTLLIMSAAVVGPLPGPGGSIVFFAGLGLLATEFVWARRLLLQLRDQAEKFGKRTDSITERTGIWPVPVIMVGFLGFGYAVVRYGILPYEIALAVIGGFAFPVALLLMRMVVGWWRGRQGAR